MEFTIDRWVRTDLIIPSGGLDPSAIATAWKLAPDVQDWLKVNTTEEYRATLKGRDRFFHLWFKSERDATLFKTFFG